MRNYTLLTSRAEPKEAPFDSEMQRFETLNNNGSSNTNDEKHHNDLLGDLPNATILPFQRLSKEIVADALQKMILPCKVVVSGPDAYNDAARTFLEEWNNSLGDKEQQVQVTILSA